MTIATEEVCRRVDRTKLRRHLEEFAKYVKLSGSPAERESFRYLETVLESYGYATNLIDHPAYISLPGHASLTVDGRTFTAITHSFSLPSPENGLRAPIIYVGDGEPDTMAGQDLAGRIVVFEGMAQPAAALRASQAGAAGVIHISPHEHLHEMCVSSVWGSPDAKLLETLPSAVIVTVAERDGALLKAWAQNDASVEATIHADVDTGWRDTPLLEAEIAPASASGQEPFVMFSGHHDTWHYGVMDNGGANATMLEVARILADNSAELKRTLRLCFWSGHSHGRYTGSAWYADNRWFELESRCAVHVNVDSTGGRNNTDLSRVPAAAELRDLAREVVRVHGDQSIIGKRVGRAGDQSFWGIGVPSLFMGLGEQDGSGSQGAVATPAAGMDLPSFGWWWHTPDDTLDKMDDSILERDTRIYVHALWRLATEERLPLRPLAQLDDLQSQIAALAEDLRDRFDLRPVLKRISSLKDEIEGRSLTDGEVMTLCRELVPLDYTAGDRFVHDPALPQKPYPLLDCFRALAKVGEETGMVPFHQVECRRACNRIEHSLDRALRAMQRYRREG